MGGVCDDGTAWQRLHCVAGMKVGVRPIQPQQQLLVTYKARFLQPPQMHDEK